MDRDALEAAAELCRLVEAPDLLTWLGLPKDARPADARAAFDRQRKRMQSMQGNPKFREVATFLIKNYRRIEDTLTDVPAYLDALDADRASTRLPMLEIAIDGVLADGVLTPEEASFVRDQAMKLGISAQQFEAVLRDRCEAKGVAMPLAGPPPTLPPHATVDASTTGTFRVPMRTLQMAHRAAGVGWWDDAFTRMLSGLIPDDVGRLVDLSCGLGWAALSLLPTRPSLEYLGIDTSDLHVDMARRNLTQAGLADRALLHRAEPSSLPLPDKAVDAAICIMSLQTVADTRPLFRQAARILRPGGRFVVVEPDCLSQQFWFEGSLHAFNDAFRGLCARVDAVLLDASTVTDPLGQPGLAIGPTVPARLRAVGLDPETVLIHPVQVTQQCTGAAFARRLRKRIESMRDAGALREDDPAVLEVYDAVAAFEASHAELRAGSGVHLLPLFVSVGFSAGG